jgi:sulfatase maturation enzyme AslB (radical SAM superfamily)
MCSPTSSRALIKEWKELRPELGEKFYQSVESVDWFSNEEFWGIFEKYLPKMQSLYFAGGEPLLVPQVRVFLERIVASGHAKQIKLILNTNLTILSEEMTKLWQHFGKLKIIISLEGFGRTNEYIRYPSKWENMHKNLMTLDGMLDQLPTDRVSFNTTVQVYNIFDLDRLVDYTSMSFKRIRPFPFLSPLTSPEGLNIQALPIELKKIGAERLRRFIDSRKDFWLGLDASETEKSEFLGNINGIINFMNEGDMSEYLPSLIRTTEVFDRHRSQRVCDYVPELASLFPVYKSREDHYESKNNN